MNTGSFIIHHRPQIQTGRLQRRAHEDRELLQRAVGALAEGVAQPADHRVLQLEAPRAASRSRSVQKNGRTAGSGDPPPISATRTRERKRILRRHAVAARGEQVDAVGTAPPNASRMRGSLCTSYIRRLPGSESTLYASDIRANFLLAC